MGAEENTNVFKGSSAIDIYGNTYLESIRIPNKNEEKANDFYITNEHVIVDYATEVVVYGH